MATTEPVMLNPLLVLADMADLLRRLPTLPDPEAELAIGRAIARADLLVEGQVPRLVAIVTDRAQRAGYTARCTTCRWHESEPLALIAVRARTHAVTTGHVVHVLAKPSRLCRCGQPIEPDLEFEVNDPEPLRTTCRACAEETV